MTGNEPNSSLTYSTQAELKPSKAWLDLVHFHPYFSRYTWISPIKSKAETLYVFQAFKSMVELQLNTKIKSVQSDWGVNSDLSLLS